MFSTAPLQEDVEFLVEHLASRGWVRSRVLQEELGLNDRHIRSLAEHSKGRIISGNQGYRFTCEATPNEFAEFESRLSSQARKSTRRIQEARRVFEEVTASKKTNPF